LDDNDNETEVGTGRLTIVQLVRGSIGVLPGHAGRSTSCFWDSTEMGRLLNQIWEVLEAALKILNPGQQSLVAWCFGPPERDTPEIRMLIDEAKKQSPELYTQRFVARPLSPGLTGIRTTETALINLIGIVKVFEDVTYGDLLSGILHGARSNSVLLNDLEQQIPRNQRANADCDRLSPIPQLLVRCYSRFKENESGRNKDLSFVAFLEELETQNNLAGVSDRALAARLAADPAIGTLPSQIKKLPERHQRD